MRPTTEPTVPYFGSPTRVCKTADLDWLFLHDHWHPAAYRQQNFKSNLPIPPTSWASSCCWRHLVAWKSPGQVLVQLGAIFSARELTKVATALTLARVQPLPISFTTAGISVLAPYGCCRHIIVLQTTWARSGLFASCCPSSARYGPTSLVFGVLAPSSSSLPPAHPQLQHLLCWLGASSAFSLFTNTERTLMPLLWQVGYTD